MATFPEALNGYNAATPADNTPAGTDSVGTQLDDHLRDIKANVKNAGALTPSSTATAAVTMAATDFNKLLLVDPSAAARTVSEKQVLLCQQLTKLLCWRAMAPLGIEQALIPPSPLPRSRLLANLLAG